MQFININAKKKKKKDDPKQRLYEPLKAWLHNNNSTTIWILMYFYFLIQRFKLCEDKSQRVMLDALGMLKGTVP